MNNCHSFPFRSESWHALLKQDLIKVACQIKQNKKEKKKQKFSMSKTSMSSLFPLQQRKVLENLALDTSYDLQREAESKKTCFQVRSKVNMYCADKGFWSDWSQTECTG